MSDPNRPQSTEPGAGEFKSSATLDLDHATYDGLKRELLAIRNAALPGEPVLDFDADKNHMGEGLAGNMDNVPIRYPRRAEKEELLAYALDKAKQTAHSDHRAMLLTSAVTNIHLFEEGNGRSARRLYRRMTGAPESAPEAERDDSGANMAEREHIDLGTAFTRDSFLSSVADSYAYYKAGIDRSRIAVAIYRPGVDDDVAATRLSEQNLTGLPAEEAADLAAAVGADEYGNTYAQDANGLAFAATSAVNARPELAELIRRPGDQKREVINLFGLLDQLSGEEKQQFVADLWTYRKLRALASIDFFTDDFGATPITNPEGRRTTIREEAIARTNNFVSRPPGESGTAG